MSIASNVITASLQNNGLASYASHAQPVIADLDRALERAVDTIVSEGTRLGASEEQVKAILVNAGLVERPAPEPVQETATTEGDLIGAVQGLVEKIDGLVSFARQHGFRG